MKFEEFAAEAGGPRRIAEEITEVVSRLLCVRRVALFGSLAEGRADAWSDIDMLVACEEPDRSAWAIAEAIAQAKPVLFFRRFTSYNDPPAGRYWFVDESPFNRLDISFHTIEDYQAYVKDPQRFGHAIKLSEVYSSGRVFSDEPVPEPKRGFRSATERETEIGSYIYFSLEALKHQLRGLGCPERHIPRIKGLEAAVTGMPRDAVMSGGRIGELAHQVHEMLLSAQLM